MQPVLSLTDERCREVAWQTYLRNKFDLLRTNRGGYAWIVGDEIRAVCADREELCRELVRQHSGGKGIIVKIEDREPPVLDIPTLDIG
ncbi:hypothetical protein FJY63_15220 [Candidatus Sumerlaeota bacterium]|nr:hypothetical protein [Candidatus Sumerlaeota bacterium]